MQGLLTNLSSHMQLNGGVFVKARHAFLTEEMQLQWAGHGGQPNACRLTSNTNNDPSSPSWFSHSLLIKYHHFRADPFLENVAPPVLPRHCFNFASSSFLHVLHSGEKKHPHCHPIIRSGQHPSPCHTFSTFHMALLLRVKQLFASLIDAPELQAPTFAGSDKSQVHQDLSVTKMKNGARFCNTSRH